MSSLGVSTEENVGNPVASVPVSSVDFKIFGELFRCGLGSIESCSTKNTSESNESIEILDAMLKLLDYLNKCSSVEAAEWKELKSESDRYCG